jgi:hypothetical protein
MSISPPPVHHLIEALLGSSMRENECIPIDLAQPPLSMEVDESPLHYLERVLVHYKNTTQAAVLYGGYLEKRIYYSQSRHFKNDIKDRSIHLGLDIWAAGGTPIYCPVDGLIHSFRYNDNYLDYGATIVVQAASGEHILFGHVSLRDLENIDKGSPVHKGQLIAHLGYEGENGGWPPHLHFQRILDMEGHQGDYPGVVAESEMEQYIRNCPDPAETTVQKLTNRQN